MLAASKPPKLSPTLAALYWQLPIPLSLGDGHLEVPPFIAWPRNIPGVWRAKTSQAFPPIPKRMPRVGSPVAS